MRFAHVNILSSSPHKYQGEMDLKRLHPISVQLEPCYQLIFCDICHCRRKEISTLVWGGDNEGKRLDALGEKRNNR